MQTVVFTTSHFSRYAVAYNTSNGAIDDGNILYTVRKGDNLSKKAKQFNSTVSKLVPLNGIKNKNKIKVGQTLKVSET